MSSKNNTILLSASTSLPINLDDIKEDDQEDEVQLEDADTEVTYPFDRGYSFEEGIDDEENKDEDSTLLSKKGPPPDTQVYLARLKKRSDLISEVRAAYLRDIVVLKHQLEQLLTNDERLQLLTQWKKSIPSIDLRQHLMLYAPDEASLDVIPCETCGGSVEIIHHDSSEIEELSKALSHLDKNKDELRVIIATRGAQIEVTERKMEMMMMEHQNEKRVLFNQMKVLRQEDSDLKTQLSASQQIIQTLRQENSNFKVMHSEHFVVRDRMQKAEVDNIRLKNELRAAEEGWQNAKDRNKLLNSKFDAKTRDADELSRRVSELLSEVADGKESVQRYKANSDSYQRRNEKLQGLLETSRKEVEDLQALKSNLLMDLEQSQTQSAQEIENLESMLDTLREEKEVLNFSLKDVQDNYTAAILDKEQAEAAYNDVYLSHTNYKEKSQGEIAELRAKIKTLEDEISALKMKVPDHPVDPELLNKVQNQLKALQEENLAIKNTAQPQSGSGASIQRMNTDKRSDGRRVGVVVKDGKEASKRRETDANNKPLNSSTRNISSLATHETATIIDDLTGNDGDGKDKGKNKKVSTLKRPKKKDIAAVMSENVASVTNDDNEAADENEPKSGKTKVKYKPKQRLRGKTTAASKSSQKGDKTGNSTGNSTSSSGKNASDDGGAVVERPGGEEGKDGEDVLGAIPSTATGDAGGSGKTMDAKDQNEKKAASDGDTFDPDAGTSKPEIRILRTMSSRRITRLASLESKPENPHDLIKKASTQLMEDSALAEEAGVSEDNHLRETFFRQYSSMENSVDGSHDEDEDGEGSNKDDSENESEDEFEDEMSSDVAKTWGNFTKLLNDVLTENLGMDQANHITHVVAPITIEFSSLLVKSTLGMWRAMKIAKRNADLCYKLKSIAGYIAPYMGFEALDEDDIENAQRTLKDPVRFDRKKEGWMAMLDINRDLMSHLCKQELDPETGKLVDSKASSYFGYDNQSRNYKFEVALSTILQMKDFNDVVLDDVDEALKKVFVDWSLSKLQALKGGLGDDDGFGGSGEGKIAKLYDQLNGTERKNDLLESKVKKLEASLDEATKALEEMSPIAKRASELQMRNEMLAKSLAETNSAFDDIDAQHSQLIEKHSKLEMDYNVTSEKLTKMTSSNALHTERIGQLEKTLMNEEELHKTAASGLAHQLQRERARLNDLCTSSMQTEPDRAEVSCQTDFNVPLMSLRHKGVSEIARTASASSKRVYFPVVTPGTAHMVEPSLGDAFPENSIGFDDRTFDSFSLTGWSSVGENSDVRDSGTFKTMYSSTSRADMRSAPMLRSKQLQTSLPAVEPDISAQSMRAVPSSPVLFSKRRDYEPPKSAPSGDILHLFNHQPVAWEAISTADRLAHRSASARSRGDQGAHQNIRLSARNVEEILGGSQQHRHSRPVSAAVEGGGRVGGVVHASQFQRERARLQSR